MATFSQMIDKLVLETRRPDMLNEFVSYLNQTIREVHMIPSSGNVAFYQDNYREAQITADSETGFGWSIPNPGLWQGGFSAQFASALTRDHRRPWPVEVSPGPRMDSQRWWYYRAGQTFYFGGHGGYGGIGGLINVSWYEYPKSLKYFPVASRPCSFDVDTGFSYLPQYDVDDDTRAAARLMCTNWLLDRWDTVIEEGLRAKIYKRLSDQARQGISYSLYMQLRQGLYTSEVAQLSVQHGES